MSSYIAVESGLSLEPGWEMDMFAYHPRLTADEGRRFHILGAGGIEESLADPSVGAVVVSDTELGIWVRRALGGYRPLMVLKEEDLLSAAPALRRFRLARTIPRFGQHRDVLYVLLPR
jgi:hypothetical protein